MWEDVLRLGANKSLLPLKTVLNHRNFSLVILSNENNRIYDKKSNQEPDNFFLYIGNDPQMRN
jgi:hypothetical protein